MKLWEAAGRSPWRSCWVILSECCQLCLVFVLLCWEVPHGRTNTATQPLSKPCFSAGMGIPTRSSTKSCPGMRVFDSELDETEKGEVKTRGKGKWKLLEANRENSPCSHPCLVLLWVLGKFQVSLDQFWSHFRLSVCCTQLESKKHLHTQ